MRHLRFGVVVATLVVILTAVVVTNAWTGEDNDVGRYQAFVLPGSVDEVFMIDTKEGHLWTWISILVGATGEEGRLMNEIRYEGKLQPGERPGEVIFRWFRGASSD